MEIEWASSSDPAVLGLLAAHPSVAVTEAGFKPVSFRQGEATREIGVGDTNAPLYGLVELNDNNPMVCADSISFPSPTAVLALIALGPIILAGVAVEPPLLHFNVPSANPEILEGLKLLGEGPVPRLLSPGQIPDVQLDVNNYIFGKGQSADHIIAAQLAVNVQRGLSTKDVQGLYDERFGRSLYVRRQPSGYRFRVDDLAGKPYAYYTVEVSPNATSSTVVVQVAADPNGKAGAAGLVHAMNVMAGLEESLGLPA